MDSLKEKNEKKARRFGMNKKELLSLVLAGAGILGLAAGNVIAGMAVDPKKAALERIPASPTEKTVVVYSNPIVVDGILAVNGTKITLQLSNGFFLGNARIGLCYGNRTVAEGKVSSSDNCTVELNVKEDIGSTYVLRVVSNETHDINSTCENVRPGVPVKIKGGLNPGDKVELKVLTSTGTLFEVKQQYRATLTKATDYLDPTKEYKEFRDVGRTSRNATYRITDTLTAEDFRVRDGNFTISLSGDFTGVANATVEGGGTGWTRQLNATNNWTATGTIAQFGTNGTIRITVTGRDVLTPRTFKVSLRTVPGDDIVREIFLLKDEVSHEWLMPGVTYYIPFVVSRPGEETYIVLQAKKGPKPFYNVTISALDDNGDFKSIPARRMNPGDRMVITASEIKAQVPSLTKDRFAVMINVDGDESQIFAYANICSLTHPGCRRVPVKAQGGKIVE